ncbi:MAG: hypothetical protein NTNFB02_03480 [Nitrospira sp.]
MEAVRVTAPFPVPEAGLRANQAALSLADQVRVPPPVLLMLSVCDEGAEPPCVAVKETLIGLIRIMGGTGGEEEGGVAGLTTGGDMS